ncbi:MAG TPA: sulfurtransferase [Polyangiaceae bacterium]|nr:sulfurtransferase [Polyangiaceae bacterium]
MTGGAPPRSGARAGGEGGAVTVSAEWLAAHLGDPGVRVVDVRGKVMPPGTKPRYLAKRSEYQAGHIPGAVFVDWTRDIVDPSDPVPMQVAAPGPFAARMGELGIGDDALVVAYDDYDHIFAGRLAWALRYYGHDAVRVLDGGWARWLAEGRPTSADVPPFDPAVFTARPRPSLRRTAGEVAGVLGRPDVVLIDARPADQYAGVVTAAARAGHIPGAVNVPYARLVDATTGRFLPSEDLARVFRDSGVDVTHLPHEVIVYCNGGVSCTVPLNALRLLGRDDVAVYDGSWNEWGEDPSLPIRTGHEP